jgi:hypothetical protein
MVEEHRSIPMKETFPQPYRSPYDLVRTESDISRGTGGRVGPGAVLDECRKSGAQRDAIPRPFRSQRVAIRSAISQLSISMLNLLNYGYLSSGIPPLSLVHINRRFTEICGR